MRNEREDALSREIAMARILRFSKHFVHQWVERMGALPSIEEINTVLTGSLRILKQRTVYGIKQDGTRRKHRELSHFWNHNTGCILLVDELAGTVVTVLTPDMRDKYAPREPQN